MATSTTASTGITNVNNVGACSMTGRSHPTLLLSQPFCHRPCSRTGLSATIRARRRLDFPRYWTMPIPEFRACPRSSPIRPGPRCSTSAASTPILRTRCIRIPLALSWTHGKHNLKFGGEQRLFFNNFRSRSYPTGYFHFCQTVTENVVGAFNPDQGNPFADILLGHGRLRRDLGVSSRRQ